MNYPLFLSSLTLLGISMCFTPGPNNALAMATGLDKGFRAALPFCIGAAVGANISLVLLGFGLGTVFTRFPFVYEVLRYLGAAYMLWLAWRISGLEPPGLLRGLSGKKRAGGPENNEQDLAAAVEEKTRKGITPLTFFQAMLLQLLNVKVWITNVIIVSNYVGTGDDMRLRFAIAVVLFTFMGGTAMCCWAASGVFMRRFLTSDGMRRANYLFAAFLALSVVLLFV